MSLKEIAIQKALKAQCTGCYFLKKCTPEILKVCADSYVKGFIAGHKYKTNK